MSIAGILFIILFFVIAFIGNKSKNDIAFRLLLLTVSTSIFINIGTAVLNLSYICICEYLLLIFMFLYFVTSSKSIRKIKRNFLIPAVVLLLCILVGDVHLILSNRNPEVIPFTTRIDSVYHSELSTSTASFSDSNIAYIRWMLIFILIVYFSTKVLDNDERKEKFLFSLKTIFELFFILWTFEWIVNNIVSPTFIRDIVYYLFGVNDTSKTYDVILRWGFYGFNGLFTEPSYITVMIVYYCIMWKFKLQNVRDWIILIWSIIILIINGSTSGAMLIPMGIFILLKNSSKINKKTVEIIMCILFAGIILAIRFAGSISSFYDQVSLYLNAYLTGGTFMSRGETSAAIRKYGNDIAYSAFLKRPLFGVGLGTTRGYGILPGSLACLGLIGTLSYLYFLGKAYTCKINKDNVILLILVLLYSTTILSVWYLYYPLIIPICIVMTFKTEWINS